MSGTKSQTINLQLLNAMRSRKYEEAQRLVFEEGASPYWVSEDGENALGLIRDENFRNQLVVLFAFKNPDAIESKFTKQVIAQKAFEMLCQLIDKNKPKEDGNGNGDALLNIWKIANKILDNFQNLKNQLLTIIKPLVLICAKNELKTAADLYELSSIRDKYQEFLSIFRGYSLFKKTPRSLTEFETAYSAAVTRITQGPCLATIVAPPPLPAAGGAGGYSEPAPKEEGDDQGVNLATLLSHIESGDTEKAKQIIRLDRKLANQKDESSFESTVLKKAVEKSNGDLISFITGLIGTPDGKTLPLSNLYPHKADLLGHFDVDRSYLYSQKLLVGNIAMVEDKKLHSFIEVSYQFLSDDEKSALLQGAALAGHKQSAELLVKFFLEEGLSIDRRDESSSRFLLLNDDLIGHNATALTYAACAGQKELVEFLLRNGASASSNLEFGTSSLFLVLQKFSRTPDKKIQLQEIAMLLVNYGAKLSLSEFCEISARKDYSEFSAFYLIANQDLIKTGEKSLIAIATKKDILKSVCTQLETALIEKTRDISDLSHIIGFACQRNPRFDKFFRHYSSELQAAAEARATSVPPLTSITTDPTNNSLLFSVLTPSAPPAPEENPSPLDSIPPTGGAPGEFATVDAITAAGPEPALVPLDSPSPIRLPLREQLTLEQIRESNVDIQSSNAALQKRSFFDSAVELSKKLFDLDTLREP